MRNESRNVRKSRTRRVAVSFFMLLATAPVLSSGALATTFQNVGPKHFGDDDLSASVNPFPAIAVSTIQSAPPGQCAWINTGLADFKTANPDNGSGPSHDSWTFTWAGVADEAKIEAGISILDYYPYVVNQPAVVAGNDTTTLFQGAGPGEFGGAVMNLKYTPQPGAPVVNNLHWIQGLTGTIRGNAVPTGLDNFTSLTTFTRDMSSPYYDGGLSPGTAGRNAGGGGWFVDTPLINENEYENNPVADMQFQVILAGDVTSVVGGVTHHEVTLFGGEWWGFNFTAADVPEPAAFALVAFVCGAVLRRPTSKRD